MYENRWSGEDAWKWVDFRLSGKLLHRQIVKMDLKVALPEHI